MSQSLDLRLLWFPLANVDWSAWSVVQVRASKANFLACPMERAVSEASNDYGQVM